MLSQELFPCGLRSRSLRAAQECSTSRAGGQPASRDKRIPGWTPAEAKLRKHWSLLGFEQVPNSDVFALSLTTRRPSMETVIHKYFAGKRRRRSNAQPDS
jgi:hypothetical protein